MGCPSQEQDKQSESKKFKNIIDCFRQHKLGEKKHRQHKDQETGFQFGAPTDLKTNEMLEEIDNKLYDEELNEGECSEETIIKKIQASNARDYKGPTKIDS